MTNPLIEIRACTTCMHGNRRSRATHVATSRSGTQWFACDSCALLLEPSCGTTPVRMQPLEDWASKHGMRFDSREQVQADLTACVEALDAADAATDE